MAGEDEDAPHEDNDGITHTSKDEWVKGEEEESSDEEGNDCSTSSPTPSVNAGEAGGGSPMPRSNAGGGGAIPTHHAAP